MKRRFIESSNQNFEQINYLRHYRDTSREIFPDSYIFLQKEFKTILKNKIKNKEDDLFKIKGLCQGTTVDQDIINKINNTTTAEERLELMKEILKDNKDLDILKVLLESSTPQIRNHLYDILKKKNHQIKDEDFFETGNILLYTLASLKDENIVFKDLIELFRDSFIDYEVKELILIILSQIDNPEYKEILDKLGLLEGSSDLNIEGKSKTNLRGLFIKKGLGISLKALLGMSGCPSIIVNKIYEYFSGKNFENTESSNQDVLNNVDDILKKIKTLIKK